MKTKLHIIKIGGNIIDDDQLLQSFIEDLSSIKEPCMLVHGGGRSATAMSKRLGIETKMTDGRRITDAETLDVIVMVYAGLINKKIVALMQSKNCNAIGLCGADANIITAKKREATTIDYGFVGDINPEFIAVNTIKQFIENGLVPVISPVTHDGKGQLLNTNADTIASSLAGALAKQFEVHLYFCFEKNGVLKNMEDEHSLIPVLDKSNYEELKSCGMISHGMIPKIDNAFNAIENGVSVVTVGHASHLKDMINKKEYGGTRIA